jgi:hypothetical protein
VAEEAESESVAGHSNLDRNVRPGAVIAPGAAGPIRPGGVAQAGPHFTRREGSAQRASSFLS